MDAIGLTILERELAADATVLREASAAATLRLRERCGGFAEASAYELARFYTVIEKSFERVCLAFENHFDKRQDYHERLLQRMVLDLPGIRPAFLPPAELTALRDLKGFRHIVRHAYDLTLRPNRLSELAADAERISAAFPQWTATFAAAVKKEQGWAERQD
ncbi:MAG: hypothetical protein Q7S40_06695 [Opitutaceae bacterium]|nr:hypothetical protein [Opitutaceae bacterium]